METLPANTLRTDSTRPSGLADAGRGSEHHNRPSQVSLLSSDEATLAFQGEGAQEDEVIPTPSPPINTQNYQPLASNVVESTKPSPDAAVNPVGNVEGTPAVSKPQWRPTYLRRRILVAFSVIFVLMIALLEYLNVLSARNGAIAKGHTKDHYLWTYGPTAFLTLIAALFNRVEYQAKLMAPWERLSKHSAPAEKNLLLDYISPLQPVALYESLKNRDFIVAATTTISLVIKMLIVLSSGLITLSRIAVHYPVIPMELQGAFVDDGSPLRAGQSFPYWIMHGLIEGSSYPPGISPEFAYQSVQSNLSGTAQYEVVVDGLTTNLQCEIANLSTDKATVSYRASVMNLNATSPGCNVTMAGYSFPHPPFEDSSDGLGQVYFGNFDDMQCDGTEDDAGKRVLVVFGLEEWYVDDSLPANATGNWCGRYGTGECSDKLRGRLLKSAQLLCAPNYDIAKVEVVQNGTEVQSVSLAENPSNRTLDHVSPWDFVQNLFRTFRYSGITNWPVGQWREFNISQERIMADDFIYDVLESQATPDTDVSLLFDANFVQSITTKYFRQASAVMANQLLMESAPISTNGSAVMMEDRLVVREWAVQWMAGLVAACLILSLFAIFAIPRHEILHQSPSTLSGTAAIVAHSSDLLERLRYSGDADSKTLRRQFDKSIFQSEVIDHQSTGPSLSQRHIVIKDDVPAGAGNAPWGFHQSESSHAHPWVLHPMSRLGLVVILMALVITLEVVLHQSRIHKGLGNVGDDAYIHYTWTSLPTLLFGSLAMMLSSMDFSIRSLAPYTSLRDVVTGDVFRNLDFLDMSVPSAMFKEAKLRNIGALATTSMLLVASFFTIFSGSLFQSVYFSSTSTALFRVNTSFGEPNYEFDVNPALILLSNFSYPSFTYEDLAFPQFVPETSLTADDFSNTSLLSISAVVPALRPRLLCRMYNTTGVQIVEDFQSYGDSIEILDDNGLLNYSIFIRNASDVSYFGWEVQSGLQGSVMGWGKIDRSAKSKVGHIAAMACNQSIEVVDVETTFVGADLAIDVDTPPRVVPNTERASSMPMGWNGNSMFFPDSLPNMTKPLGLSDYFALLTQSRWAIPLSMLGGGNDDAVVAAIKFQNGIFFAQALNQGRIPAIEANATLASEQAVAGENDAGRTYEATVVDKAGQLRVVQDAVSTRVLEALLLVTLILLGVGWLFLPKTDVLPKRSPTTIASAVALLSGGNLREWLGEDGGISGALGGRWDTTKFWLGWGTVPDEEGILMGNENENGISQFGIFAVKADHVDSERRKSFPLFRKTTKG